MNPDPAGLIERYGIGFATLYLGFCCAHACPLHQAALRRLRGAGLRGASNEGHCRVRFFPDQIMSRNFRILSKLSLLRIRRVGHAALLLPAILLLSHCASDKDRDHVLRISVPEQKLALYKKGVKIREYPVSTSKFGLGNQHNSKQTPLGKMEVAQKIGGGAPSGAVFKSRRWTGEVLRPDSPGRDPIVSRILWLRGVEPWNSNTFSRYIYIHGTAEERNIGRPVSYGCVRMRSQDVIDLYSIVGNGADVYILNRFLPTEPTLSDKKDGIWTR